MAQAPHHLHLHLLLHQLPRHLSLAQRLPQSQPRPLLHCPRCLLAPSLQLMSLTLCQSRCHHHWTLPLNQPAHSASSDPNRHQQKQTQNPRHTRRLIYIVASTQLSLHMLPVLRPELGPGVIILLQVLLDAHPCLGRCHLQLHDGHHSPLG